MLSDLFHWGTWLELLRTGAAAAWLLCLALAMMTLLLEDVAIAAGVSLASQGSLSWELSFLAVAGGIALGDVALYGLGAGARRWPWLRRRTIDRAGPRQRWLHQRLNSELASAVLLARVIPGLRLLTYTACGFLRVALLPFCLWVALAVAAWTAGLYALSLYLGQVLAQHWGIPLPLAVALPILAVAVLLPLLRRLWRKRLSLHRGNIP